LEPAALAATSRRLTASHPSASSGVTAGSGSANPSSDGKLLGRPALDRAGCGRLKDVARKAFDAALRRHQDNAIKRAYAQAFARTQNAAHARLTVMRKIVAVMRAMWIDQTPYRDELG
jgi:hypothetical protein